MTHVTRWTEDEVLDYLHAMARNPEVDRIALLRQIAEVNLDRPSDWDMKAIRQAAATLRAPWRLVDAPPPITIRADECWSCGSSERRLYWHHAITVGHGGSSTPRNLFPLCHRCHRGVHPWLPAPTSRENRCGWTSMRDLVIGVSEKAERVWGVRETK